MRDQLRQERPPEGGDGQCEISSMLELVQQYKAALYIDHICND